ncbi:transmembrane protein, putative (macronuclear) [Tetrahymena thermophila SB210]|uniref:Transmembrane protein, putative n=1 Tax=Tetrahymena thermophila (strain SB210) TaxID=312017 RepID=W7X3N7_TETTS|nr:transmembrane protein, putative [Tetrahymena thermophila SB210]EWS73925.1 transmembrane protein, putative [Tetrahymena thermophila SB210]|eukprot:XP_012653547.1 transmembrane protein, putative [Tetrahymena thermophila SB210]
MCIFNIKEIKFQQRQQTNIKKIQKKINSFLHAMIGFSIRHLIRNQHLRSKILLHFAQLFNFQSKNKVSPLFQTKQNLIDNINKIHVQQTYFIYIIYFLLYINMTSSIFHQIKQKQVEARKSTKILLICLFKFKISPASVCSKYKHMKDIQTYTNHLLNSLYLRKHEKDQKIELSNQREIKKKNSKSNTLQNFIFLQIKEKTKILFACRS